MKYRQEKKWALDRNKNTKLLQQRISTEFGRGQIGEKIGSKPKRINKVLGKRQRQRCIAIVKKYEINHSE